MELLRFDTLQKTWYEIAKSQLAPTDVHLELMIHKKLLNVFQAGAFYYYIFCPATTQIEYASKEVMSILHLSSTQAFTPQFVYKNLHPDDQIRFVNFENEVTTFFNKLDPEKILKYKVCYDFRLKDAHGNYQWILHQATTIQSDEQGSVLRVLGIHTVINHLKTNEQPSSLSFIGLDGEPSFFNVNVANTPATNSTVRLTKSEKAIMQQIILGKTSKQIAESLHVSIHTVNTHRKNMLKKWGCKSIPELMMKAIQAS